MSLTPRQKDCLEFLIRYVRESGGVSPSYDEIADDLGVSSKSAVHRLVKALEERRFVVRLSCRSRAITVLKNPDGTPHKPNSKSNISYRLRQAADNYSHLGGSAAIRAASVDLEAGLI